MLYLMARNSEKCGKSVKHDQKHIDKSQELVCCHAPLSYSILTDFQPSTGAKITTISTLFFEWPVVFLHLSIPLPYTLLLTHQCYRFSQQFKQDPTITTTIASSRSSIIDTVIPSRSQQQYVILAHSDNSLVSRCRLQFPSASRNRSRG